MGSKTIRVRCKGTKTLPLDRLKSFQGNLKTLRQEEYLKLRRSIQKHGFRFPIFVWKENVLDGHQRIFTIREMIKEGFTIGPIPVVEIQAENEKEAREMVLLISSRYGRITEEGLHEFVLKGKPDLDVLKETVDLPEIDISKFKSRRRRSNPETTQTMVCPKCGHRWEIATQINIKKQKQPDIQIMN